MRYQRGAISITRQDAPLLNLIARARFITRSQLTHLSSAHPPDPHHARKARWRVRRFLKDNLIIETKMPPEQSVLSITRRGVAFLKCLDSAFAQQVRTIDLRPPNPNSTRRTHEVALNGLWLAFKRSGHLVRWVPSFDIYIAAQRGARASLKQYDALATLRTPQGAYRVALEYERVIKRKEDYLKIISAIRNDVLIPIVIYVCATERLAFDLIPIFMDVPKVFFTTEEEILSRTVSAYVQRSSQGLFPVTTKMEDLLASFQPTGANSDF